MWERWDKGVVPVESCTIITTNANEMTQELHDRMPVILDAYDLWLDPHQDAVTCPPETSPAVE